MIILTLWNFQVFVDATLISNIPDIEVINSFDPEDLQLEDACVEVGDAEFRAIRGLSDVKSPDVMATFEAKLELDLIAIESKAFDVYFIVSGALQYANGQFVILGHDYRLNVLLLMLFVVGF